MTATLTPTDLEPESTPQRVTPLRLLFGVVRTARPRQWVKNLLVTAAPFAALAAGKRLEPGMLGSIGIAFAAFCIVSSGVYFVNDARDAPLDRQHPKKRFRPVAAGIVPPWLAYTIGVVLLGVAIALGGLAGSQLQIVLAVYAAISMAYCFFLKDQPVIDLAVIAGGFLLRAMAGGLAAHLQLSDWFLLVASFGSLFIAAGKRYSEAKTIGEGEAKTRKSLAKYTVSYLRFVWGLAAAVAVTGYALWAFQMRAASGDVWPALSVAPFVLALLRYAVDIDSGAAGSPEDIVLHDRVLQSLGVLWVLLLALGLKI
jgi:decaprenyl-phosphate phosphoribosyltransferase